MKRTLHVLNELEQERIFARYAIGGAMGATFYVEPLLTFDLDIFVLLPTTRGDWCRSVRSTKRFVAAATSNRGRLS